MWCFNISHFEWLDYQESFCKCSHHLENIGLLSYADLPKGETFHQRVLKKKVTFISTTANLIRETPKYWEAVSLIQAFQNSDLSCLAQILLLAIAISSSFPWNINYYIHFLRKMAVKYPNLHYPSWHNTWYSVKKNSRKEWPFLFII